VTERDGHRLLMRLVLAGLIGPEDFGRPAYAANPPVRWLAT
jgi:hypothetical protein